MKRSVLIVDDEFGLAEMLSEVLEEQGYDVSLAVNGEGALACLSEKHFDLVLLDVMMPVMDGGATLARMRADAELRAIPVVMMSAFASARPVEETRFQGFLLKPFTINQLLTTITPLLAA